MTKKIKTDLHIHTKEDPQDFWHIKYTAKELIDKAKIKNIKIISITLHNKVLENKEITQYAKKQGIFLIKGTEKTIEGHHVLIYGITNNENKKIKNFNDLKKIKRKKNILIIAPHPYYPNILGHKNLHSKVEKYKELFDAIEIQQLYTKIYNPNKKAIKTAKKLKKGIIANSDAHNIKYFGEHYTNLELPPKYTQKDIFEAIKNNKTQIITKPKTLIQTLIYLKKHIHTRKIIKKIFKKN